MTCPQMQYVSLHAMCEQVYKKPADYKRSKKPGLLSVKPLYLHLDLTVTQRK